MPRINNIRMNPVLNPQNEVGAFGASLNFRTIAGVGTVGQAVALMQMERDGVFLGGQVSVGGTLGAACTVQLVHTNAADTLDTVISPATTAAAASRVQANRAIRFVRGDTIGLLVAGAAISAAADVQVDLMLSHNPVIAARA